MNRSRTLVILGGLVLVIVAVLIFFFADPAFLLLDSNDLGITLFDATVFLLVILAFFSGLFLIVEGSTNARTAIKRTLESSMMHFKHKTHQTSPESR